MEQQTKEWHELRRKKIGASDAPVIMGESPWKTPLQLWEEKLGFRELPARNSYMDRGIAMEEPARRAFIDHTGIAVNPIVKISTQLDFMMASMDGLSEDGKIGVEIKCPGQNDHALASMGVIPNKYFSQLQHQMFVCELETMYYYSFDGQDGVILKINRDDAYLEKLIEAETEFYKRMINLEPPKPTEKDYVKINDSNAIDKAKTIQTLRTQAKELSKEADRLFDELVNETGFQQCEIGQIKITKVVRKGAISYEQIPELKVIDLERYRKEPSYHFRMS